MKKSDREMKLVLEPYKLKLNVDMSIRRIVEVPIFLAYGSVVASSRSISFVGLSHMNK